MAATSAPGPKSLLGRHRLLSPTAAVRVSPLSLGGMSLGEKWAGRLGLVTKETAFELLDTFYELGGNFIDTANAYQGGQSEEWIGEWVEQRGRRSEMVIATKYTLSPMTGQPLQESNYGGNGTKSMHVSINNSLKSLRSDYVDIYFVHAWDYSTDIPELMQSLNHLVAQGKVLYLGISDAPAWVVSKANTYARAHGLRPFSIYQGRYSAVCRDLERDVIPMCREEGMAIHAWGVLGNGYIRSPTSDASDRVRNSPHLLSGREGNVSAVLDNVAKRHGVPITSVALAYAMHKAPYFFPVVGGRKVEHLKANVEALSLELTPEDVKEIESGYEFDLGFPHSFLCPRGHVAGGPQDVGFSAGMGHFDYVQPPQAIRPYKV